MRITPLIMCGGAGTRLWPASREAAPKQFIKLLGERSTFQDTLARVSDTSVFTSPIVITNARYHFMVVDQLNEMGATADLLLEPMRRDSGPAVAAAASFLAERDEKGLMLVLAADHVIRDEAAFHEAVEAAAAAAEKGQIVTFGVKPDHAATGYGYLKPGAETEDHGICMLEAFIEKPSAERAAEYLDAGFLWNSGNFLFRVDTLLGEYRRFDEETVEAVADAVGRAEMDLSSVVLDQEAFSRATARSLDYAVMEKTDRARVVPVSMGWSDVGSWQAVWEITEHDENGNAVHLADGGEAAFLDANNNYVRAEDLVCLVGVSNLAVIQTRDATLVFDRSKPESVKELVKELERRGRSEVHDQTEVFRPWGSYQSLDHGERFQVKRIVVKPGGQLSLQKHFHRAEHWIVVRGTAVATVNEEQKVVRENESIFIPLGAVHRLENPGRIPLELIEVQSGSYLGEDDIVRLEDIYNRT